uniref:Uncharacterized protein n=1 Tax=Kalanchoe fedtschenkoi TaxID=63787 RepID=A0A7N0RBR8_KALFE
MQTSRRHGFSDDYLKQYEDVDPYQWGSAQEFDGTQKAQSARIINSELHRTGGSSSVNSRIPSFDPPSSDSFPANDSPQRQLDSQSFESLMSYPIKHSHGIQEGVPNLNEEVEDFGDKMRELESVMFGPDLSTLYLPECAFYEGPEQSLLQTEKSRFFMQMISRGDLREVLLASAKAMSENDLVTAEWLMSQLNHMVSVSGEPMQRLGAYMLEGLIARLSSSGSSLYKSLRCKEPVASANLLSYMHLLYEVCPYFKFGYMSANGAIAEAMRDENRIHIIDFQIAQGSQWFPLIQALSAQPCGPPQIRITGIDDPVSSYARGGGLDIVGKRLSKFAESCNVPFEFCSATVSGSDIEYESLRIRHGEAIAVNFAFMLHHMPDESVGTQNHRDRLLRLVKCLSPKVVTLVEHESNTNTSPFFPRFLETLDYYAAIFESIDATLPREHEERINVEQHCLAREIVNIVACEGAERVERHELLTKWKSRFVMSGFSPYPLSSVVNATIKTLLENYCDKYRLEEKDGALYLGWLNRALVASSAWR